MWVWVDWRCREVERSAAHYHPRLGFFIDNPPCPFWTLLSHTTCLPPPFPFPFPNPHPSRPFPPFKMKPSLKPYAVSTEASSFRRESVPSVVPFLLPLQGRGTLVPSEPLVEHLSLPCWPSGSRSGLGRRFGRCYIEVFSSLDV